MRAVKVVCEVRIFREKRQIPGTDFRILKNGVVKERKPEFDIYYNYGNEMKSYPYDSIQECAEVITSLFEKRGCNKKVFSEIMNY